MTDKVSTLPSPSNSVQIETVTEYVIQFTLVMYAIFAPHSIAITEGSVVVGFLAWAVQLSIRRSFKEIRT
ncbi:MAG TPA: hypothetical protein VJX67_01800, partial [Blastocatellia bacterium]|nr:hypothetical protein [Blastocatellia bacterium]